MAQASLDSLKLRYLVSLDQEINYSDGGSKTLGDTIPDLQTMSVEDELDQESLRNLVIDSFKLLTDREEQVIRMRFGITDNLNEECIFDIKE